MSSVLSTDLIPYSPANVPEDDVSTTGGAIDTTTRPDVTQLTATGVLSYLSDGADTRQVTTTGRNAAGSVVSETITLTGTTPVAGGVSFERILKVVLSGTDASRTLTILQGPAGPTRVTIVPNEIKRHIMFQKSASGSSQTIRYEKLFWKNTNGATALTAADITLTADPSAKMQIGLATAINDTVTVANRLAAPASVTFSDDNVVLSIPGTQLAAADRIGVWVQQTLAANDVAYRSTFTTRCRGTTV